jgi:hypothetical protein
MNGYRSEKLLQVLLVGKGNPPAVGLAPDVNKALDLVGLEESDEFFGGMVAVADSK